MFFKFYVLYFILLSSFFVSKMKVLVNGAAVPDLTVIISSVIIIVL